LEISISSWGKYHQVTRINGWLADQTALSGLLDLLNDLGRVILTVERIEWMKRSINSCLKPFAYDRILPPSLLDLSAPPPFHLLASQLAPPVTWIAPIAFSWIKRRSILAASSA